MHALTVPTQASSADRLGVTVFFAVLAHLIVILGVTFSPEDRSRHRVETLDVVLVPLGTEATPEHSDYVAQASRDGGGDTIEKIRPATPLPSPITSSEPAVAAVEPASTPVEPAAAMAADGVATALQTEFEPARIPAAVSRDDAAPVPDVEVEARMRRVLAIAALSAEIERDLRAYAERPRRKWISASTREHRFAAYMDAWRRRVEQIGNLNYPEEAERRGLAGDLLLDVAIRPDGTVEEITLRRSSGERVLDDAAIRIVEIAAPFSEFPEDIAEDVDILHIERTWIFHSGGTATSR